MVSFCLLHQKRGIEGEREGREGNSLKTNKKQRRIVGRVLYLLESNLHLEVKRNAVKLVFPSALAPSVIFTHDSHVVRMLVCTLRGVLYRFTFERLPAESIFSLLYQSAGPVLPRTNLEIFAPLTCGPVLAIAKAHGDSSVVVIATTPKNSVHIAWLGQAGQVPHLHTLDGAAASPKGICSLPRDQGDSILFVLHGNASLSAYSVQSRTRVCTLRLPHVGHSMRLTALGPDTAVLSILAPQQSPLPASPSMMDHGAATAMMQVQVAFRANSLDMEVNHVWDLVADGGALVMDFRAASLSVAMLSLDNGKVLRCVGAGASRKPQLSLVSDSTAFLFSVPESPPDWRLWCHAFTSDGMLLPESFFHRLALEHGLNAQEDDVDDEQQSAQSVRERVRDFALGRYDERSRFVKLVNDFLVQYQQVRQLAHIGEDCLLGICGGGLTLIWENERRLPPMCGSLGRSSGGGNFRTLLSSLERAIPLAQWRAFDEECAHVNTEEAAQVLTRWIFTETDLGVRVPSLWRAASLTPQEMVTCAQTLIHVPLEAVSREELRNLREQTGAGPLVAHTVAWILRAHIGRVYNTLRTLLTLSLILLHGESGSGIRGIVALLTAALSRLVRLRNVTMRCSGTTGRLWRGLLVASGAVTRRLQGGGGGGGGSGGGTAASVVDTLCVGLSGFLLSEQPLILLASLRLANQWECLEYLAPAGAAAEGGGAILHHYAGLCKLQAGQGEGAMEAFGAALNAALSEDVSVIAKLNDGPLLEPYHASDQYWLGVMGEFERAGMLAMVVRCARIALRASGHPSVFWVSLFRHNLLLRNYTASYLDILASASSESAEDVERRLGLFLKEFITHAPAEFCQFAFSGNQLLQVANLVLQLARDAAVHWSVQPNFYEKLYAFHIHHGNYRQASCTMYEYATRLRLESTAPFQVIADAMSAACAALRVAPQALQHVATFPGPLNEAVLVVSLRDMERQCALMRARASLRQVTALVESPSEIFTLLVATGSFAHALRFGVLFDLDMRGAFVALAQRLVRGLPFDQTEWNDGKTSEQQLCDLVRRYDGKRSNFSYGRCVAEVFLTGGVQLPPWLIQWMRNGNPSSLLQLYISFDLLHEAQAVVEESSVPASALPLHLVDTLLHCLPDDRARHQFQHCLQTRLETE